MSCDYINKAWVCKAGRIIRQEILCLMQVPVLVHFVAGSVEKEWDKKIEKHPADDLARVKTMKTSKN